MRDLTVDRIHTYYVLAGDTPVLVHNKGGPEPCRIGQAGEAAAGIKRNTIIITINGRDRVPDELDPDKRVINEVKNRKRLPLLKKKLPLLKQIRDYLDYADAEGYRLVLYVDQNTRLSRPLQDLVDSGRIDLVRVGMRDDR